MLSANEHGNQDKYDLSTMVTKYQLFVYLADSLFDDEQYKRAEVSKIDLHELYSVYPVCLEDEAMANDHRSIALRAVTIYRSQTETNKLKLTLANSSLLSDFCH